MQFLNIQPLLNNESLSGEIPVRDTASHLYGTSVLSYEGVFNRDREREKKTVVLQLVVISLKVVLTIPLSCCD